tara:strand:- start:387 stop:710 length:324 start_codon:yes stop_codon:yes gene_type:complete
MNIPENLQNKIIMNAFIMKKNENNWLKIHNFLKTNYLKLKKTNNIYEEYFQYEAIDRTNGCFFVNKPYIWLNKFYNTNKYYYANSSYSFCIKQITQTRPYNRHFNLS